MLTNYPKLTDAESGSNLSRPLLLSAIEENTDRNGKTFVKVTLKDGFSEVTALMFATSAADLEARLIVPNTVVDADLAFSEYQGNKSYKVSNLAPAADKLLSVSDFVKLPPVDLDVMYHEIIELLNSAADNYKAAYTPLSDLAIRILLIVDLKDLAEQSIVGLTVRYMVGAAQREGHGMYGAAAGLQESDACQV